MAILRIANAQARECVYIGYSLSCSWVDVACVGSASNLLACGDV